MEKERKYGIDLLRLLAAFMIVLFHSLTQGGVLDACIDKTSNYYISWFLMAFTMGGVDIFALISGYISYSEVPSSPKYSRLVELWLIVVFYSLLLNAVFDIIRTDWVSPIDYLTAVTPLINCSFWYFTGFFGMYVFKPIIDNGIRMSEKKTLFIISIFIIVFFSVIEFLSSGFGMNNGFSVLWIISLYVIGAIIRKHENYIKIRNSILFLIIILLGIITYFGGLFISEYYFMDIQITQRSLFYYNSPTILISSVCYLIIFSRLNIKSKYGRLISVLGMSTFSVYIVNCTEVFWNNIMNGLLKQAATASVFVMLFMIFIFVLIFMTVVLIFDILRKRLFNICGINKLFSFVEKITT